jgi:hypothetical protein
MIFLVGASAIYLTALQASINAPRSAFQTCLKNAVDKAQSQKVAGDGYEAFVRTECGGQMNSFRAAVTAFDIKNKMTHKDASSDADSMIADFVTGSADHYRYVLKSDPAGGAGAKPAATEAKATITPAPTPAAAPASATPAK